jgi:hypothetical protein
MLPGVVMALPDYLLSRRLDDKRICALGLGLMIVGGAVFALGGSYGALCACPRPALYRTQPASRRPAATGALITRLIRLVRLLRLVGLWRRLRLCPRIGFFRLGRVPGLIHEKVVLNAGG